MSVSNSIAKWITLNSAILSQTDYGSTYLLRPRKFLVMERSRREYFRQRREKETPEERDKRLNTERQRQALKRANETEEERNRRLNSNRERKRTVRRKLKNEALNQDMCVQNNERGNNVNPVFRIKNSCEQISTTEFSLTKPDKIVEKMETDNSCDCKECKTKQEWNCSIHGLSIDIENTQISGSQWTDVDVDTESQLSWMHSKDKTSQNLYPFSNDGKVSHTFQLASFFQPEFPIWNGNEYEFNLTHKNNGKHTAHKYDESFNPTKSSSINGNARSGKRENIALFQNSFISSKKQAEINKKSYYHKKVNEDGSTFCDVCDKNFSSYHYFQIHQRIHTGDKPYCCSICGRRFLHNSSYSRHRETHIEEKCYPCDICEKKFKSDRALRVHKKIHTEINICDICNRKYTYNGDLRRHIRNYHATEERSYICDICDERFLFKIELKKHFQLHIDKCFYYCNLCDRTFINYDEFKIHKKVHIKNKNAH